jgi:hypothetical protein
MFAEQIVELVPGILSGTAVDEHPAAAATSDRHERCRVIPAIRTFDDRPLAVAAPPRRSHQPASRSISTSRAAYSRTASTGTRRRLPILTEVISLAAISA